MGCEDVDTTGSTVKVTDYGLGARGVDYISATQSGTTTVGFPIYDAHGNMTACIFRYGTNYYSVNNQRHYDAWGVIRSGATTGDPKGRYCATIGHKQDDESGLIYMRARAYEPSSGRFLSEDTNKHSSNWFVYCNVNPLLYIDQNGEDPLDPSFQIIDVWLGEIESLCLLSSLAKVVFVAQFSVWTANIAEAPMNFKKDYFIGEAADCIFPTRPLPSVSIEDQARAETEAYALSLQIDMWLILKDD